MGRLGCAINHISINAGHSLKQAAEQTREFLCWVADILIETLQDYDDDEIK
jgi:hypothetical protein